VRDGFVGRSLACLAAGTASLTLGIASPLAAQVLQPDGSSKAGRCQGVEQVFASYPEALRAFLVQTGYIGGP
jgi:hypothetical protein